MPFSLRLPLCILLLVFYFGVLLLVSIVLVLQTRSESAMPIVRERVTGVSPQLHLGGEQTWHVFLSHVWGGKEFNGGQDQCGTIKRRLQMLVPQIRCFLDVDDLQNIGDLEAYVDRTQVVIIFLTTGYGNSPPPNICLEAFAWQAQRRPSASSPP